MEVLALSAMELAMVLPDPQRTYAPGIGSAPTVGTTVLLHVPPVGAVTLPSPQAPASLGQLPGAWAPSATVGRGTGCALSAPTWCLRPGSRVASAARPSTRGAACLQQQEQGACLEWVSRDPLIGFVPTALMFNSRLVRSAASAKHPSLPNPWRPGEESAGPETGTVPPAGSCALPLARSAGPATHPYLPEPVGLVRETGIARSAAICASRVGPTAGNATQRNPLLRPVPQPRGSHPLRRRRARSSRRAIGPPSRPFKGRYAIIPK